LEARKLRGMWKNLK